MLFAIWTLVIALLLGYALLQASMYPDRNKITRFIMFCYGRPVAFGGRMNPRRQALVTAIIVILIGLISFVSYFFGSSPSGQTPTVSNRLFLVLIGLTIVAAFVVARMGGGDSIETKTSASEVGLFRNYALIFIFVSVLLAIFLLYRTLATP
jgi:hypothetical protein